MFCPKCGTKNPDDGKFCRKCGTDLAVVSQAIGNESDSGSGNLAIYVDPTGISAQVYDSKKTKDPDDIFSSGLRQTIGGFGFLVISALLFLTNVANGQRWWWALLFPAFSMMASGISKIAKANRLEKRKTDSTNAPKPVSSNPVASLPPTRTDYVSPNSEKYQTGDLVPSSVIENTTRHLKTDSEGETMTLPQDKG